MESYADHSLSLFRDFTLGRSGHYGLRISVQARNLGGQNYEIIRGYPMSGRSFRITIKIAY